uniref:Bro-N domain-containing protein n=1 Tax=Caenorhabditis tropicalis TaxID=1561998 RepID=A0A1I7TAW9_9PELO
MSTFIPNSYCIRITNTGDSVYLERVSSRLRYPANATGLSSQLTGFDLNEYSVKTHKGYISMNEINEKVFKLLGYEIDKPTHPFPTLRMINEPTCELVFTEWIRVSQEPQPTDPPRFIPSSESDAFLLFGYAGLGSFYINDKNSPRGEKPQKWDKISELMEYSKENLSDLAYHTESSE